jgi:hypothetical protein
VIKGGDNGSKEEEVEEILCGESREVGIQRTRRDCASNPRCARRKRASETPRGQAQEEDDGNLGGRRVNRLRVRPEISDSSYLFSE